MDGLTTEIMIKALDGLTTRSIVVAENIANAGTPGYRPLRLSFEQALADAAAKGPEAVKNVEPRIERVAAESADAEPRVDLEIAIASATSLRYSALIDLLNRSMQLNAIAVSGGR